MRTTLADDVQSYGGGGASHTLHGRSIASALITGSRKDRSPMPFDSKKRAIVTSICYFGVENSTVFGGDHDG